LPENNKDIDSASDSFISENITNSEYLIIYSINGKEKKLSIRNLGGKTYGFKEFSLTNVEPERIYNTIDEKFVLYCKLNSLEIMVDVIEADKHKINFLKRNKFSVKYSKIVFEKNLQDWEFNYYSLIELTSLKKTGRDKFLEIYGLVGKGDIEMSQDYVNDFNTTVVYAGERYDPENWYIASVNGKIIGLIMPQIFADKADEGSLFYIGVLPNERNKGYGKILFQAGLQILKERGAKRYIGSTNTGNKPMLKLFEGNNCKKILLRDFYTAN